MTEGTMLNRRMTSLDASFLYLEQPNAFLHIAGIYILARPINYDTLLSHLRDRRGPDSVASTERDASSSNPVSGST